MLVLISSVLLLPSNIPHANAEQYLFQSMWGSSGSGDGQFVRPNAVALDSSGNVYVIDEDNDRIQKFTSTGTFIISNTGGIDIDSIFGEQDNDLLWGQAGDDLLDGGSETDRCSPGTGIINNVNCE